MIDKSVFYNDNYFQERARRAAERLGRPIEKVGNEICVGEARSKIIDDCAAAFDTWRDAAVRLEMTVQFMHCGGTLKI